MTTKRVAGKRQRRTSKVLNVKLAGKRMSLRLHQFAEPTSDDGVKRWMREHASEVRAIQLDELSALIESHPRELTSLVGKFDIVPYACHVDSGEARLPALPILTRSGKIETSPNWTRGQFFKWDQDTRFLFVER